MLFLYATTILSHVIVNVIENRTDELLKEISRLESLYKGLPVSGKCEELIEKKAELRTLLNEQALRVRDINRKLYFQQGNKLGKLLARALRQWVNTSSIIKIKSVTGDVAYDPKGILNAFHTFYTRLYNIPNQLTEQDPEKFQQRVYQYIKDTALPTLSVTEVEQLEQEFSELEIQTIIDSLVPGKSPGPDGFTPRF